MINALTIPAFNGFQSIPFSYSWINSNIFTTVYFYERYFINISKAGILAFWGDAVLLGLHRTAAESTSFLAISISHEVLLSPFSSSNKFKKKSLRLNL